MALEVPWRDRRPPMTAGPCAPAAARRWTVWHPQQRLWNRELVTAIEESFARVPRIAAVFVWLVVLVDSVLLLGTVLRRRVRLLGARPRATMPGRQRPAVLYIDCGVHEEGLEIRWMRRWFAHRCDLRVIAFEAGSRQFAAAAQALADVPSMDLRHEALVGPQHTSPTVSLYSSRAGAGHADSIFAARGPDHEDVPAARLSEVLLSQHASHDGPVILRMNIEGAELVVVDDLVDAGLDRRIDGYYGMWNDLSEIDDDLDARLRGLLRERGISPLTFNGRDLGYGLRRLLIRMDVATSIRNAELRGPAPLGWNAGASRGHSEQG
jgi:FkbM family methyltransferase